MQWTESIVVDRPLSQVRDAVADENQLVQWSAWPEATGYVCSVDGDGRSPGSEIVFRDREGVEQGRQQLWLATADRVEYRLRNRGPFGREMTPQVHFRLEQLDVDRTRVHLDFRGSAPLPPVLRGVAERLIGVRVRALHVADLERLKTHVERGASQPS